MKLAKIIEIDNGYLLELVEDESLRTFNELNVRKYVETWAEVLSEMASWNEKVENYGKEGKDEKETKKPNPDTPTNP